MKPGEGFRLKCLTLGLCHRVIMRAVCSGGLLLQMHCKLLKQQQQQQKQVKSKKDFHQMFPLQGLSVLAILII